MAKIVGWVTGGGGIVEELARQGGKNDIEKKRRL